MRIEPTFLIVGASKSGTTSIWDLLRQHPQVAMCQPKEPNFFSLDSAYEKGWDWYSSFFTTTEQTLAIGDVSPMYSRVVSCPRTVPRIAEALPSARILYVVRHPLDRIESDFLQCLHSSHPMPRCFARAVREYLPVTEGSLFWKCISAYRKYFTDDQIHVLFFEDFRADPDRFLADCCRRIGVDETFQFSDACRPRNRSRDHDMESRWMAMARHVPGMSHLKRTIPASIKSYLHRRMRVAVPSRPKWDGMTRQYVTDMVADEARALLQYAGKPADFWSLEKE
ncbi:MAG: sulfotransferase [Pirellulales bacterium]|nr:sulfotransferase [Pirellulales bacterium]